MRCKFLILVFKIIVVIIGDIVFFFLFLLVKDEICLGVFRRKDVVILSNDV